MKRDEEELERQEKEIRARLDALEIIHQAREQIMHPLLWFALLGLAGLVIALFIYLGGRA